MDSCDVSKRESHPIGSLILMASGAAIMLWSLHYEFGDFETPGAGFLPFFAGLAMAVFSAIPFLQSLKRGWNPLRGLWQGTQWPRVLIVTGGLIFFSVFLKDLGFLLATMIIMGCFFRLLEKSSWKVTLFAALATTFGFYLVFQIWLQAQLPRGFLGF